MSHDGDRRPVVFVLGHYGVGGAEKQLANLILHRPNFARELEVDVITFLPTTSPEVEEQFTRTGAKTTLIDRSTTKFAPFFLRLYSVMKGLRPLVVCTVLEQSTGTWGRLAAWLTRVPAIYHSDRALGSSTTPIQRRMRPFLDKRTTGFLPNAFAIAKQLEASGVPARRIRVIHNGVDLRFFDADATRSQRADWGIRDEEVVLGYLGRFDAVKRIDVLLEAVLRLAPEGRPDWILLAGDGEEMPTIRGLVQRDPWLSDHCRFLGTIADTPGYLKGIDYLVLASEAEGFPNVVLEAMAMGKPVVATAVSDVPTMIGHTGLLAEPGDTDSLATAIERMQQLGREGRAALGELARNRVRDEYSIELAAERFWGALLGMDG